MSRYRPNSRRTPSYSGLKPRSPAASAAARRASKKSGTRCEVLLRRELFRRGLRYRINVGKMIGRPDIVFTSARLAIFCDGDFWHGRHLDDRISKLSRGHNSTYWVKKIRANVRRDKLQTNALQTAGWTVLRLWETDIARDPMRIAERIAEIVRAAKASAALGTGD
jgi:DNA mismatch endonuclease, patch repair protein